MKTFHLKVTFLEKVSVSQQLCFFLTKCFPSNLPPPAKTEKNLPPSLAFAQIYPPPKDPPTQGHSLQILIPIPSAIVPYPRSNFLANPILESPRRHHGA
jgi:hypothetical protein